MNRFGSWHKVCVWFGFVVMLLEMFIVMFLEILEEEKKLECSDMFYVFLKFM